MSPDLSSPSQFAPWQGFGQGISPWAVGGRSERKTPGGPQPNVVSRAPRPCTPVGRTLFEAFRRRDSDYRSRPTQVKGCDVDRSRSQASGSRQFEWTAARRGAPPPPRATATRAVLRSKATATTTRYASSLHVDWWAAWGRLCGVGLHAALAVLALT